MKLSTPTSKDMSTTHTDREELIERSLPFLEEIKDMTTGTEVEQWLNRTHGPVSYTHLTLPTSDLV